MRFGFVVSLMVVALALLPAPATTPAQDRRAPDLRPTVHNRTTAEGVAYRLHVFTVPLDHARLEVLDLRMSATLAPHLRRTGASLVINGGFFGMGGEPEGLVVSRGQQLSPLHPRIGGGVFVVAGAHAALHAAEEFAPPSELDFAMQCRPRLVVGGEVNIRRSDGHNADRTALCVRDEGRTLDVVIARTEDPDGRAGPTLYELANVLRLHGCEHALNLDGGPSTGAAWRQGGSVRDLPPRSPVRHAVAIHLDSI